MAVAVASACGAAENEPRAGTESLERYGIRVAVPAGWHARLTRGTLEAATVPLAVRPGPLRLGAADLAVRLFEFEPDPRYYPASALDQTYADGPPRPFDADEFGSTELGGDNPANDGFARRNFRLAGRLFDLFVESGATTPPASAVAALNELVASLEVSSGDFYPGQLEPPRFGAAEGWHVGSGGGGAVRASDYAEVWAATVPYRNEPRDLPPVRTLETLSADGILIWVGLARDNRYQPTGELRRDEPRVTVPLRLGEMRGGVGWEGQVREISLYRLHGLVPKRYHVDAWVFFGDGEPTPEQRDRAQAMLDRLELPDWGQWELDERGSVELAVGR